MTTTGGDWVYVRRDRIEPDVETKIDFGVRDAKGRAIGYVVTRAVFAKVECDAPPRGCGAEIAHPDELGTWFVAEAQVTRDGQAFGAYPGSLWARTPEDLERMIEKRIAGARARYQKAGGR